MKRPVYTWIVFGLCVGVAMAALGWISAFVIRLDRSAAEEQYRAAHDEDIRRALWRMDFALSTLIGRESARPPHTYESFHPTGSAYTQMLNEIPGSEILVPSPLLTADHPEVLIHFQYGPDGSLTSPQAPTGNMRDLAEGRNYSTHEEISAAAARLEALRTIVERETLRVALAKRDARPIQLAQVPDNSSRQQSRFRPETQKIINSQEQIQRQVYAQQAMANVDPNVEPTPLDLTGDVIHPMWFGSELILARRVTLGKQEYLQGCWLDWPTIRRGLLEKVKKILPQANLIPTPGRPAGSGPRMLASVPAMIDPGAMPEFTFDGLTPARIVLYVAWISLALAALAVAVLLKGALDLSERRGAFVSAVTHELRTPLTSFRMYTEMLSEGMIGSEEKRRNYLSTLRREADRLGHLVENVLAYARLDGTRPGERLETVGIENLLDRIRERLTERARQAEMEFVVEAPDEVRAESVRVDPSAVEQILFNLVDNACKYAATAPDRTIRLEVNRRDGAVVLRISDHGPGIRCDVRRLFRPFSKSARDAADSAPGLGLGLALSRRLARSMQGDLSLDPTVRDGTCFVLTLPPA